MKDIDLTSTNLLGLPAKFECQNVHGTPEGTVKPQTCFQSST